VVGGDGAALDLESDDQAISSNDGSLGIERFSNPRFRIAELREVSTGR
jgi:hypothetical protein